MEVYDDGQWGTICDTNWGEEEAGVMCKELGYSGAIFAVKKAYFGQGTGPVCKNNCVFVSCRLCGFHKFKTDLKSSRHFSSNQD